MTVGTNNFNITGGSGNDTLNYAAANLTSADTVNGNGGTDTIALSSAGTSIDTTSVSDVDNLTLFNGTNTVTVGTNNFNITGGSGNDTLNYAAANLTSADTINGNGGTDTIALSSAGTSIDTTSVSDVDNLTLFNGTNTVTVGTNNFNITGGSGNDTLNYAAANLTSADTINGNGGTDTIALSSAGTSINVTNVSDVDNLTLANGTNTVTVGTNNFNITGGTGDDVFSYALADLSSADTVDGNTHSTGDTLNITGGGTIDFGATLTNVSNVEKVTLAAATTVTGNATNFDITGSSGDDQFTYTAANMTSADTISGGSAGNDALILSSNGASIDLTNISNMDTLTLSSGGANTVTVGTNNFNITGGTNNDTLIYAASNLSTSDVVNGNGGTDTVSITGGGTADATNISDVDSIVLAAGTTLTVGATNFNITGSTGGNDTLIYAAANLTSADVANGVTGTDAIQLSSAGLLIDVSNMTNFDTLTLFNGTNSVTVGTSDFAITGGTGNDTLIYAGNALTANDVINGNGGTDTIQLNTASTTINTTNVSDVDNLTLANGTNTVTVGTNNFNITGGTGDDTFVYAASQLSSADTIDGGADVTVDTLQITGAGAIVLTNVTNVEALDLTGMTGAVSLTGGGSILSITGTGFDDQFTFNDPDFHGAGVSLAGGVGTDTLVIKDTGAAGFTLDGTDLDGTNTKEIENITFDTVGGATTATVTLLNAFVDSATGDNVTLDLNNKNLNLDTDNLTGARTVTLTGDGSNTITLTGTNNINIITDAGFNSQITLADGSTDEVTGGTGNDTIVASDESELTAADSIVGGGTGTDVLVIQDGDDDGSTIAAGVLDGSGANGGVSGFETIKLVIGTTGNANAYSLVLNDAFVTSSQSNAVTVDLNTVDLDVLTTTGVTGTVTLTNSAGASLTATMANGVNHQGVAIAASKNSTITLGDGNNTITGNSGNDTFIVQDNQLTGADSLTGGTGTDVLSITGSNGNVDFVGTITAVSGFEALTFDSDRITGTDTLVISDDLVTSATGTNLFLRTTGGGTIYLLNTSDVSSAEGDVVIDTNAAVSLANAANRVVIDDSGASARNVTILGGTGSDTIVATNASFDANDSITGGGTGTDVLEFLDAVTITGGELSNKSGIETITLLAGSANTIALTDAFVDAANGGTADVLTINNGTATVSLDASNVTSTAMRVVIGGAGAVTLSAAATKVKTSTGVDQSITGFAGGGDTIITANGHLTAADTISGGATGTDTLAFDDATTLDLATVTNVTGFENLSFLADGSDITLSNAFVDASAGLSITGSTTTRTIAIDTSAVSQTKDVKIVEGVVTLDSSADRVVVIDAAASIAGGAGQDRFVFTEADDITTADSLAGDGGTADAIIVKTDTTVSLDMTGATDLTNVATVEFIAFTGVVATAGDVAASVTVDGASEIDFIVNDGTLALDSSNTAGDVTVLSTGTITLANGDALTLADISGTIAHTASTAWGAGNEIEGILTAYTGGTVTLAGAAGTVVGGTGADSVDITAGTAATTSVTLNNGNDSVSADDNVLAAAATISGGTGTDVLTITDAANVQSADWANKSGIDRLELNNATNTQLIFGAGDVTALAGGTLIIDTNSHDLSSLRVADGTVSVVGGGNVTIDGAGTNIVTFVDGSTVLISASGGNDTITGSGTANDTWTIADNLIASTDRFNFGAGTADVMIVTEAGANGADLNDALGTVAGNLETLKLDTMTNGQTSSLVFGNNADTFIGAGNSLTLDLNGQDEGPLVTIDTNALDSDRTIYVSDTANGDAVFTLNGTTNRIAIKDGTDGNVTGSSGADTVIGGTGADTVAAGAGNDSISGGSGTDSLSGEAGDDTLDGGANDDTLVGGADNDLLIFGTGGGQATGGTGDDVFRFTSATGSSMAIQDFSTGGGNGVDKVQLDQSEGFAFGSKVVNTAFQVGEILLGSFTTASSSSSASAYLLYDTTDRELFYDADANGGSTAVLLGTMQAGYVFNFTDFQFVS